MSDRLKFSGLWARHVINVITISDVVIDDKWYGSMNNSQDNEEIFESNIQQEKVQ